MKPNDKDVFMGGDEGDEDEYNMAHQSGGKRHKMVGSRAQVWHRTAKKTSGGLMRKHLKKNKHGRIVSKKMSATVVPKLIVIAWLALSAAPRSIPPRRGGPQNHLLA